MIILIVDDSRTVQAQIKKVLSSHYVDAEFLLASSGNEALDVLSENGNEVDLGILDYNMEGMNGIELAEKLLSFISSDKLILCTANIQDQVKSKAIDLGIKFTEKPFTTDAILSSAS